MHRTEGTWLVHIPEFPCICILCLWWVSLLLADLHLVAICLFVYSQQLVVAGYYYYYCLSNNQWWLCTKIGVASLLLDLYTGRDGWLFQASYILYVYILYLRREDTILVILCTSLPITITLADEWINSLIFHDDIKFMVPIIYVTWWVLISCKKLLGSAKSFLIYAYSFQAVSYG